LYMHPTYTFSEMTTEVKREQVLTDESTGETHDAFADFAHVVTDKDNTVPDEPKCFENGLQLNCRSMPGFEATKKSSYMSLDEQAIHEDGIPFQIRAKVASKEDLDVLLKIVEASAKRLKSGLERAIDNWVDVVPSTPAFGSITTHGNPATSIQNDATVSAQEKPAPSVQDKPSQPEPPRFGAHLSAMLDVASQHNTPSEYAQAGTANPPNGSTALGPLMGDLQMQSTTATSQSHPQFRDKPQLPNPKKNGRSNHGQSNHGRSNHGRSNHGRSNHGRSNHGRSNYGHDRKRQGGGGHDRGASKRRRHE
jgi:hypothetical protein